MKSIKQQKHLEKLHAMRRGKVCSEETKKKISESKIANPTRYWLDKKRPLETCKKMSEARKRFYLSGGQAWNKGKKLTTEQKKNLYTFPEGHIPWNKGKDICLNSGRTHFKKGHSLNKGQKLSEEHKQKLSLAKIGRIGSLSNNWQGGLSPLNDLIRTSSVYKKYIHKILERDDFTCQDCGERGGKLNVNHIKPFAVIVRENKIKSLEDAINCLELWDLDNLETLCVECHKKTDTYMSGTIRLLKELNL